jgi:hypothetical protein
MRSQVVPIDFYKLCFIAASYYIAFLFKPEDGGINILRNFDELNIGLHNFRL